MTWSVIYIVARNTEGNLSKRGTHANVLVVNVNLRENLLARDGEHVLLGFSVDSAVNLLQATEDTCSGQTKRASKFKKSRFWC
jgi:hypothetical protein